jgi:hypothetical protein
MGRAQSLVVLILREFLKMAVILTGAIHGKSGEIFSRIF